MKRHMNRWIAVGTLGVMSIGGMGFVSGTAQAKKSTVYKYGAIAGAGLAGYGLLKGNGRAATVGAVAAAGSYYMYKHSKHQEERRQSWYRKRYGKNWRSHYHAPSKSRHRQSAGERRQDWYRKRYGKDWKRHYSH